VFNILCPWTLTVLTALTYHFDDGLSESSSLNVFRDKVDPFVFIKQSNELEDIGMLHTAHHLHLYKVRGRVVKQMLHVTIAAWK